MDAFRQGATDTGQGRVFSVYRRVLGRTSGGEGLLRTAQGLAMRRLLEAATGPMTAEVQNEVEAAFRRGCDRVREIASLRVDSLLGAAALLDERLRGPDELAARATNFIEKIEANSRRSGLVHIRDNLMGWVAKAVSGDVGRIRAYLAVLAGLSEDREALRGLMVGHLGDLVTSPETFAAILPPLYSALVGASAFARGRAALVIGQLSKRQREAANAVCVVKLESRLRQVPTGPAAGRRVFANHEMVADRVAGHLLYLANAASFLDADVGAPVLQQVERPPVLGAYFNRLANAGVLVLSAFSHVIRLAVARRRVCAGGN